VYLQFCGRSKIESEAGVIEMEPGEIALVPSAISHRTTGMDDCLRVRVATQEAVSEGVDPESRRHKLSLRKTVGAHRRSQWP
jgi:homogentisate 1,2-dioxygenase